MADQAHFNSPKTHLEIDPKNAIIYPVPLSPPLPLISKEIELSRAMTAASKSSLFSLSRTHVLFEDDWLLAVCKPRGVYCEAVLASVPSLLSASLHSDQLDAQEKQPEFHLANRLDRDTSGVMLITKSHKVAAKLVKAFTDHKVRKTYIASCTGAAPNWQRIDIESGHGQSKFGAWRVYATSDVGKKLPGGSVVRGMATTFEVLSVNGQCCTKDSSQLEEVKCKFIVEEKSVIDSGEGKDEIVVRAYPRSGRTHQIRLHCQYLGISIRGDVKYEGVCEWKGKVYDHHELHAESLTFEHPVTGLSVVIHAPLPLWASEAL
ncbi:hypothetical protein DCAR_0519839 [Daucus carota subsp. sativus]|uniref:Pseudouridine synthase RsuA/RluA-like domain-containing protein n=1 Tax=Daucus carota subsp. sativus TaxID=79200 RepID=A0AAF0X2A5_DAUCS|nr:PREDICTED: RNA pseudouridine synthase 1-like isoform X1 [Daucus carota subsp. sativus]XP_017253413.1 PREDICTED: RNA pseudouridine synthase 1-like isoform X1 [Daucus carota subsp. sativus]XP_017253414.1 PREDICTED: RNA pseudouridine synthase 1-like isoform X1 [Daucus carota subsp. sativus]XP_017253415.1 PREDICTED: RNA pseudouridine synthase 1-like isoform X1 [Daucus carota subsp. sativus]XP_017253417.1 PREDICTED: RNA pseudouridine synthase 1-like isoform X1 [Daucus carota subsp. sativus]XP_01